MRPANGRIVGRSALRRHMAGILPFFFLLSLLAQQSESIASLTRLGADYLEQGDLSKALDAFERAVRLQPSDPALQFNVGLALYRMGRYRQALEPLGKALAHPPSAERARFLRGTIFFQSGQLEACAREIEGLRSDPGQGEEVLFMLIECYRRLGRANDAQAAFLELNRRFPGSAFVHRLMGVAYDAQTNYDKAIEEFQAALRVREDMPEIAFAIGYIYWKQQEYAKARSWLERELAGQPCYARAHHFLAEIDRIEQKWDAAAVRYRKALECDPDLADSYLGLGNLAEREAKWEEALKLYRKLAELKPNDSQPHFKVGLALQRTGRTAEAQEEFTRARKLLAAEQERDRRGVMTAKPPKR
ncbi:MAG: tetratricopeptide repeat protein [Acidobacteria bacterium]|nr:tetratricopeptide repeat protein [Acidobacteriota bacterium]